MLKTVSLRGYKEFSLNKYVSYSGPHPEENATEGKFFARGSEKFLGKIGLKELHSLCSRCLHFHHVFFYQFQK